MTRYCILTLSIKQQTLLSPLDSTRSGAGFCSGSDSGLCGERPGVQPVSTFQPCLEFDFKPGCPYVRLVVGASSSLSNPLRCASPS